MSFESLGLATELLRAVSEKGYDTATPIQQQAIPIILEGRDLMGGAQTGTGKTAGFTLPLLQRLMSAHKEVKGRRPIRALVLTPTRELAAQVAESVATYGKHLPLKTTVVFGGVSINPQKDKINKGVDVLVATPGRLLDHVGQRSVDLSKVEMNAETKNKTVVLTNFPQPEVLSIDTTINYYDKTDGYFNKFDASDLTELQLEAKTHIQDKIPESGLYDVAKSEALEAISLIENIVETILLAYSNI